MTFALLVHELDHLLFDQRVPLSSSYARTMLRLLDPRSYNWRLEKRAHSEQYDFTMSMIQAHAGSTKLYEQLVDEVGASPRARDVALQLIKAMTIDRKGRIALNLEDPLIIELAKDEALEEEVKAVIKKLIVADLNRLLMVEKMKKSDFIRVRLNLYRREIMWEYAHRLGFYVMTLNLLGII